MSSLPASMKRIQSKTAEKTWWCSFPHCKSMGIFSDTQGQLTPLSVVGCSRISNSCKLLCMSLLPASMKRIRSKTAEKMWWRPFPHYNPMGAIWSDLHQNLMQPFPHPNDASDKIWLQSACWSRRYSCLKVWTHGRTAARTPAWAPSYKLTNVSRLNVPEIKPLVVFKHVLVTK